MRALLITALVLLLVPAASAAKATGTVSLDQVGPAQGDTVTFTVTHDLGNHFSLPWLELNCHQDGVHVYSGGTGFGWGAYPAGGLSFLLASTAWQEGAASCVATLYGITSDGGARKAYAEVAFEVAA